MPQSKLHQKLIQATQVIIALVREKEHLTSHINTLLERAASSGNQASGHQGGSSGHQAASSGRQECRLHHQYTQTHIQTGRDEEKNNRSSQSLKSCRNPQLSQSRSSKKPLEPNPTGKIHVERETSSNMNVCAGPATQPYSSSSGLEHEVPPKSHQINGTVH